jgi:phage shock protein A
VTAARDIAKLCERQPELTSELERLRLHAQAWQDYARAARHATAEATESEGSVFDNGHSPQRLPRR